MTSSQPPDRASEDVQPTKRAALRALGAVPLFFVASLRAQDNSAFPLRDEAGEPIQNFRIPAELDPASLPGVLWEGRRDGDVVLYEFFDYNCAFCRKAARELAKMAASDPNLRLGLINNAILSVGSAQAAKVQQSVLRLYGPAKAYDFHLKMYAARGGANKTAALDIVRAMGLDVRQVEESADSELVAQVVFRQTRLAEALGLVMTPSFIVAGTAILGWPGAKSLRDIVADARKCDRPVCEK